MLLSSRAGKNKEKTESLLKHYLIDVSHNYLIQPITRTQSHHLIFRHVSLVLLRRGVT